MALPLQPPNIIGHRGAAGHAPENTLSSVQKAFDLGVTWVEADVKLSRDGIPVLFHDDRLDRTTDGNGTVAQKTLDELKRLDAGRWFDPAFTGESIPTLEELVARLTELQMGLILELKPSRGQEAETGRIVAEMFQDLWLAELPAPVISSFKPAALAAFAEVAPDMARALLVHKLPPDWRRRAEELGAVAIHCDVNDIKRHEVAAILEAGFTVRCYTVNENDEAARLLLWGVQSVFTDFPDRIL
jgi:glycerophosphoryl diester phosphodiesterase